MKQNKTERLYELFEEYRNAYRAEWERLDRCERVYRGDHWQDVPEQDDNEPRPVTPVLQSTIENVRADLMDRMPEAVIVSDGAGHERVAEMLTALIRENHRLCRFEREYANMMHDLLVGGYMVQETGYDSELNGGFGAAFLRAVDPHSIMFDPLVTDIQQSRAVFKFAPYPMEWLRAHYPEKAEKMREDIFRPARVQDDYLQQSDRDMVLLIEAWEREYDSDTGRSSIHMAKLAGGVLLEDSRDHKPGGYFAHGEYPFVVTPLFVRKGTPLGYGFVDMFETQQRYADKLDQIILKNALMASHNKLLITGASGFDPEDLRDWSKEVHRGESLAGVTWFPTAPLPGYILSYGENIRQSIREESGSNDFVRGQTYGGVTAASAIAALQEAGSKRSRMVARAVHGAFEEAVRQELEVEREFCVLPRRITLANADTGRQEAVAFTGETMFELTARKNRLPLEFGISVRAQQENRFSVAAHNELILNLVKLNMITPAIGLEMMLFDGKREAQALMREHLRAEQEKQLQQPQMALPQ
ncbi:MAG: hypothetical protein E7330_03570 [Clostridiales bacterium]|nr:hypothetical protein [Clostridiales bacterium]